MAITYLETAASGQYTVDYQYNRWSGMKQYCGPVADLAANYALLKVLSWTIGGIAMTPRQVKVDDRPVDAPGQAIVTMLYSFGDNPYAYRAGAATLSIMGFEREYELRYGLAADGTEDVAKPINTQPDADGKYWKAISDAISARSEATYIIRTAVAQSTIDWTTYSAWIGKKTTTALTINAKTVAAAGELRLLRVEIPEYFTIGSDDPVVPLRFVFHYRRGGFPDVSVGQYRQELHKRYIYHETDDPTAANRIFVAEDGTAAAGVGDVAPAGARYRVISMERQIDTDTRARYATADMSTLFTITIFLAG